MLQWQKISQHPREIVETGTASGSSAARSTLAAAESCRRGADFLSQASHGAGPRLPDTCTCTLHITKYTSHALRGHLSLLFLASSRKMRIFPICLHGAGGCCSGTALPAAQALDKLWVWGNSPCAKSLSCHSLTLSWALWGQKLSATRLPLSRLTAALTLLHRAGSYPESHRGGGSRGSQKKKKDFMAFTPQHRAVGIPLRLPAWLHVPSGLQKQGKLKPPREAAAGQLRLCSAPSGPTLPSLPACHVTHGSLGTKTGLRAGSKENESGA